jgi:UDP-N-acetylmuramate dehydrogenase
MDIQEVYNHLKENMPELVVKQNEEMFKHTTFKVGGKADIWIRVKTRDELIKILSYINEEKIPYYIMGNGSNILVKDNGFRGIVLKIEFDDIKIEENSKGVIAKVGAGVKLGMLANILQKQGIAGFEFATRNSWNYRWSNIYECWSLWKGNSRSCKRSNMY